MFRSRRRNGELDEEILAHLAIEKQERMDRGETAESAERGARRDFGNELLVKETTRAMWGWTTFERIAQDLLYAFRQMRRSPGFAAVVIGSLALGIGANSAIFSLLNTLLFKSLPVAAPLELFALHQESAAAVPQRFSYPMFVRLRAAASGAKGLAAMARPIRGQAALEAGRSEEASFQLVSGEFFPVLGLAPALGRLLTPADSQILGGNAVAVISHGFWQREFAGTGDVIGRTIRINGAPLTIVGVAPRGFRGVWMESPTDIWIPLTMQSNVRYEAHFSSHQDADPEKPWVPQDFIEWLDIVARTEPAQSARVRQVLNAVFLRSLRNLDHGFDAQTERFFLERSLSLEPFALGFSNVRQRFAPPLVAMMAMVALVLLIACANTANLLMARAEGRRREIAVRLSIGASRNRLIQQLLTESFLMVAIAAALGLLIARWAGQEMARMALGADQHSAPFPAAIDPHVLLFTVGLSVATGLLFGLAPAFRATRMELGPAMKPNRAPRFRFSAARLLVAFQVALSLAVVFEAALFGRSLRNLAHVALGFDREHVLSVAMDPRSGGYDTTRLPALFERLIDRAEAIPGVRSAAISMCPLAEECRDVTDGIRVSGYEPAPGEQIRVQEGFISPGYFSTVGMRLVGGRELRTDDTGDRFAVINQAMARHYFADRNPIGQKFGDRLQTEIVGIVHDAHVNRVREEAVPMAYLPLHGNLVYASSLEIRAAGDPSSIAADVRRALRQIAPDLPVERIAPLALQVDRSLNTERMSSLVTAAFGILALGLACFGLYGVMSYAVSRRTSEIGVRMALGARPEDVLWTILREALLLIAAGVAAGLPVVILGSRFVAALLYDLKPDDPVTLTAAIIILGAVAVCAALRPAWRASRVSPLAALRHE